jgi:hypothetical protein
MEHAHMNDHEHDLPPIAADSFAPVLALLAVATDPKATARRVKELRAAVIAADKARAELGRTRVEHEAQLVADRAQLEEDRADLDKRKLALAAAEGQLAHEREVFAASQPWKAPRLIEMGNGLTREPDESEDERSNISDRSNPQDSLPMARAAKPALSRRAERKLMRADDHGHAFTGGLTRE